MLSSKLLLNVRVFEAKPGAILTKKYLEFLIEFLIHLDLLIDFCIVL